MDASLKGITFFNNLQQQMLMVTDEDLVLCAPNREIPDGSRTIGFLSREMKALWVVVQKEVGKYEDSQQALKAISPDDERFQEFSERKKYLEGRAEMYECQFIICLNEEKFERQVGSGGTETTSISHCSWVLDIGLNYEVFALQA